MSTNLAGRTIITGPTTRFTKNLAGSDRLSFGASKSE